MGGLKTRAYTTSTFGFFRRREIPAPGGKPGQCAELIVPGNVATATEVLLKRTLKDVSIMGRFKDRRGTVFVLRFAGGWKRHEILGHIGRHLRHDVRIKVNPLAAGLAERIVAREALVLRARKERCVRTRARC